MALKSELDALVCFNTLILKAAYCATLTVIFWQTRETVKRSAVARGPGPPG